MFSAVVIDPRAVMGVSHAIIRSLQVRPCVYLSILITNFTFMVGHFYKSNLPEPLRLESFTNQIHHYFL